ncbi:MAG TPA: alpha/beta hydrolase [Eudoraea sp.]|nr:alpha/beta hydrolase [Eudoraea sp.]
MKRTTIHKCLSGLLMITLAQLHSQNMEGVTGVRDSSYNTASAFSNDIKKYPEIRIATEFGLKSVETTMNITYCHFGDRKLLLDVFKNVQGRSAPHTAIIIIHGGGWRTGNRAQHYPLAQRLADLGYVCITPEYRLSTEALFPAAVYDLKAVIRWVRKHVSEYNIHPDRIVTLGFSAGGELAAFMGTTGNMPLFEGSRCTVEVASHVNALIDIDGTLSFVHPDSGEGDDRNGTSAATYWFGYSKKENPLLWETASPLGFAGPATPPALFINSSVDRMHAGREDYTNLLAENNIYSEVREFKDAPHSFCLYHPWFEPTLTYIDNFLKKVFEVN